MRPCVQTLPVYQAGTSIEEIQRTVGNYPIAKLGSNENAWGCAVPTEKWAEICSAIHHYPDSQSSPLIPKLAKLAGVAESMTILGNGSDELLQLIALAILNPGDHTLTGDPTFLEYDFVTRLMDAECEKIPLENWIFDLPKMTHKIRKNTKIIWIANPNNPTGTIVHHAAVVEFLNHIPATVWVVMDEAYAEFVQTPDYPQTLSLLDQFPNLIILRTFSKAYGLAGLRLGYGFGSPTLISALHRVKQPFNINRVALAAGCVALDNPEFIKKTVTDTESAKNRFYEICKKIHIPYIQSHANFAMIETPIPAQEVYTQFKNKGIIIRPLNGFGLDHHVRITMGKPDEMNRVSEQLQELYP